MESHIEKEGYLKDLTGCILCLVQSESMNKVSIMDMFLHYVPPSHTSHIVWLSPSWVLEAVYVETRFSLGREVVSDWTPSWH